MYCYQPLECDEALKIYAACTKGLKQKFNGVDEKYTLSLFRSAAWKHLTDHGMDSEFYFEDDEGKKRSILKHTFDHETKKKHSKNYMR